MDIHLKPQDLLIAGIGYGLVTGYLFGRAHSEWQEWKRARRREHERWWWKKEKERAAKRRSIVIDRIRLQAGPDNG